MHPLLNPPSPCSLRRLKNMASTTDKVVHARKRRIISHAMSDAALRSYEPTIIEKIELFCKQIQNPDTFGGPYKNMSRWFSYLTYDTMGALTFSQSYDMLTKDDVHYIQPLIDSYQHSQVIVSTLRTNQGRFSDVQSSLEPSPRLSNGALHLSCS